MQRADIGVVLLERVFCAVYSLRKRKFTNNICFSFISLFVASIRELNKHWDSENLYSSANGVVSMC
jgi:hypothetical protein